MKESENEIDNLFQTNADQFEMPPPKNAWASLDAELDRKQAVLYKRKAYRYKLVSIGLSLLLISFISFHYFVPKRNNDKSLVAINSKNSLSKPSGIVSEPDTKLKYISDNHKAVLESESRTAASADENKIGSVNHNLVSISGRSKDSHEENYSSKLPSVPSRHNLKAAAIGNSPISSVGSEPLTKEKSKSNIPAAVERNVEQQAVSVDNAKAPLAAVKKENINYGAPLSIEANQPLVKNEEIGLILKEEELNTNTSKNIGIANGGAIPLDLQQKPVEPINLDSKNNNSLTEKPKPLAEFQKESEVKLSSSPIVKNDSAMAVTAPIIGAQKQNVNFSRFAIAAFFSPDFDCHLLIDNDNKVPNHHKDRSRAKDLDERELPDFSFTSGVLLKYDLTNKWSIQSGCTYSSSVRKIKPSTIYAEQGSDSQAHYLLKSSLGIAELPNSGTGIPQIGDSVNLKTNSKQILQFINIPLIARFQYVKNKFSFYTFAGVSANILIKEQSEVSIETLSSETIIISNITGLKKVTCGFLAGIGAQYNFYKGISVFTEPVFRGSITSINQNTSVNSYPYSIGFNTGLTYRF